MLHVLYTVFLQLSELRKENVIKKIIRGARLGWAGLSGNGRLNPSTHDCDFPGDARDS